MYSYVWGSLLLFSQCLVWEFVGSVFWVDSRRPNTCLSLSAQFGSIPMSSHPRCAMLCAARRCDAFQFENGVCMTSYVALPGSQVAIFRPDLTEVKTSGEVARAKPVTAVPNYSNRVPGNAVDGNNQTTFHSDATGAYPKPWLIIDLMSTVLVTKVRVLPFVGAWPQRVTDLRVGLGNILPPTAMDFSQYEVVGAIDGPVPMEEKWYEFEVSPPRCSRYVAIYKIVERVYDIYIMELSEMEVFAEY